MSLQSLLQRKYQLHSAFRFDKTSLCCRNEIEDVFYSVFGRVVRYATLFCESAFHQFGHIGFQALLAVFFSVRTLSAVARELRFLDENTAQADMFGRHDAATLDGYILTSLPDVAGGLDVGGCNSEALRVHSSVLLRLEDTLKAIA